MIYSLDTYVYNSISQLLEALLEDKELLRELLQDINPDDQERFIKAYGGQSPVRTIKTRYSFPETKESMMGAVVVQMGNGSNTKHFLGGNVSGYKEKSMEETTETVPVVCDGDRCSLTVKGRIGDAYRVHEVNFATSDDLRVDGQTISFLQKGNEYFEGKSFTVTYDVADQVQTGPGIHKGYMAREGVQVTPLSTDMNTARCLNVLLTAILIIMDEREEGTSYAQPSYTFSPMQRIVKDGESEVYGRPITITYTVTHSMKYTLPERVQKVILNTRRG